MIVQVIPFDFDKQINICIRLIQVVWVLEEGQRRKVWKALMGVPTLVSSETPGLYAFQSLQYTPYLYK